MKKQTSAPGMNFFQDLSSLEGGHGTFNDVIRFVAACCMRWDSMCCTCRQFTLLAESIEKGKITT